MKNKRYGFTLVELTVSMGLWILLLSSFSAALIFGIKRFSENYTELSESTRISLFFDRMEFLLKGKSEQLTKYRDIKNTLLLKEDDGTHSVIYFYSPGDKILDNSFDAKTYDILYDTAGRDGSFSYGRGKKIFENAAAPPASELTLLNGYVVLKISSAGNSFGPFQTSVCIK
jgi:hypothetical protein